MHREVKARKKCGSRRKSVGTGKKGWCEQAVEQSTSSPKASFPGGLLRKAGCWPRMGVGQQLQRQGEGEPLNRSLVHQHFILGT